MLAQDINKIDLKYLTDLPSSGLNENTTIEYKRLISRTESLLKEVCAFANTYGGDLVIGVSDIDGVPTSAPGIDNDGLSRDAYELKISQQISSGIEPCPSYLTNCFEMPNGNFIIHVRVNQSMIGPHRLVRIHKFYERNSTASEQMTIDNLRVAFGAMVSLEAAAKSHHEERCNNNPYLRSGCIVYMHLIPVASLNRQIDIPVTLLEANDLVYPLNGRFTSGRIDHLGRVLINSGKHKSISHNGRNGIMEMGLAITDKVWKPYFDKWITQYLQEAMHFNADRGVTGPGFVFTSIINGKGLKCTFGVRDESLTTNALDCQPVFITDFTGNATDILKPTLDTIWNGLGHAHCPNYNIDGTWNLMNM